MINAIDHDKRIIRRKILTRTNTSVPAQCNVAISKQKTCSIITPKNSPKKLNNDGKIKLRSSLSNNGVYRELGRIKIG